MTNSFQKIRQFFAKEFTLHSQLSPDEILHIISANICPEEQRPSTEPLFAGPKFYGSVVDNSFTIRGTFRRKKTLSHLDGEIFKNSDDSSTIKCSAIFPLSTFAYGLLAIYLVTYVTIVTSNNYYIGTYILFPFMTACVLFGVHVFFGIDIQDSKKFLCNILDAKE